MYVETYWRLCMYVVNILGSAYVCINILETVYARINIPLTA